MKAAQSDTPIATNSQSNSLADRESPIVVTTIRLVHETVYRRAEPMALHLLTYAQTIAAA